MLLLEGTYGRIPPISGLVVTRHTTTMTVVMNPGYIGELIFAIYNYDKPPIQITLKVKMT